MSSKLKASFKILQSILFFGLTCGLILQFLKMYTHRDDFWNIRLPMALALGILFFLILNFVTARFFKVVAGRYDIKVQREDLRTYFPLCLVFLLPVQAMLFSPILIERNLRLLLIVYIALVLVLKLYLILQVRNGAIERVSDNARPVACSGWYCLACIVIGIPLFGIHEFTLAFDDYYRTHDCNTSQTEPLWHGHEMRKAFADTGKIRMRLDIPYASTKVILGHKILNARGNLAREHVSLIFEVSARDDTGNIVFKKRHILAAPEAKSRLWWDFSFEIANRENQTVNVTMNTKPLIHKLPWRLLSRFLLHMPFDPSFYQEFSIDSAWSEPEVVSANSQRPKVILISLDTLRADALGCYGYERNVSPAIDSFAGESMVFTNAFSQASSTLPSHLSMFTSRFPNELANDISARSVSTVTVADLFNEQGYYCVAFTGGGFVSPLFGFHKGFHVYNERIRWTAKQKNWSAVNPFDSAQDWIRKNVNTDFFLFLHSFIVHDYKLKRDVVSKKLSAKAKERVQSSLHSLFPEVNGVRELFAVPGPKKWSALYDLRIRLADSYIHDFFLFLKENNIYDNALIIITSDHGEAFGELHNNNKYTLKGHGRRPYDSQIRVPLIVKLPLSAAQTPSVIQEEVRLIDLVPSIGAVWLCDKNGES